MKLSAAIPTALSLLLIGHAQAYEIWTSLTKVPRSTLTQPKNSELLRKLIHGHNMNATTFRPKDAKLQGDDLPMRASDWEKFFSKTNEKGKRGLSPIPRTHVAHPDLKKSLPTIEERLKSMLKPTPSGQRTYVVMPYDNNKNEIKEHGFYGWNYDEIKRVRTFIETFEGGKYKDVKIALDLRNWAFQRKDILKKIDSGLIDMIVFEGTPEKFYSNSGKRMDGLDFFLKSKDPKIQRLKIMFQFPLGPWKVKQDPGADTYQIVRRFVVWLGERYGFEPLQGDKITLQLTTYSAHYKYVPELVSEDKYADTIYGTSISLIEQEDLFAGRLKNKDGSVRKPTKEDAYSYERSR